MMQIQSWNLMQELLILSPKLSANHLKTSDSALCGLYFRSLHWRSVHSQYKGQNLPYSLLFSRASTPVRLIFIWFLSKLWWSSDCLKTVFWKVASMAVMHYKNEFLCSDRIACQGKIFPETLYNFCFSDGQFRVWGLSLTSCYRHKSNTDNRAC